MVKESIDETLAQQPQPGAQGLERPTKDKKRPESRSVWRMIALVWGVITLISSVLGALLTAYVAWPSCSITLPSASYRPRNPFTAVFAVTNAGYLPGYDVRVKCAQNLIKYVAPKVFSQGTSAVPSLGTLYKNELRTFSCPQIVLNVETFNRVLTPGEIHQMYVAGPPQEDMTFEWADFEFYVTYSFLRIHRTNKYRVVGRPGENGTFIWEQVALDKKF